LRERLHLNSERKEDSHDDDRFDLQPGRCGHDTGDHGFDDLIEVLAEELGELAKIVAHEQSREAAVRR